MYLPICWNSFVLTGSQEEDLKVEPVIDGTFINTTSACIHSRLIFLFNRCSDFCQSQTRATFFYDLYFVPVSVCAMVYAGQNPSVVCTFFFFYLS